MPITLSGPGNGATLGPITSAVLTIVDASSSLRFSAPAYTVAEGGIVTIGVLRGGSTSSAITVPYSTANASAVAGTDYITKTGTLTFGNGVGSQAFTVTTKRVSDIGAVDDRAFTVNLGTPNPNTVGVPAPSATVTIQNSDRAGQFQFAPTTYTVAEGSPVTVTVTRTGGSLGAFNVPWHVSGGGGDIAPVSATYRSPAARRASHSSSPR